MRRLIFVGLCCGVVFASGAVSASAAAPRWVYCGAALKSGGAYVGHYTVRTCTEASKVATGGKFELLEGVGKGKEFKGKSGPTVLHTRTWLGDETIACASSKDSGIPAPPNLETGVTVTYKGCKAPNGQKCSSPGVLRAGEIELAGLRGELGFIQQSPTIVGLKLESAAHPGPAGELVTFSCGGLEVSLKGGLIGVRAKDVNVLNKESETIYSAGEYIGQREHQTIKYKPLVNIVGWADEQAQIAKEIEADESGAIGKMARPILKTLICGDYAEEQLHEPCLPEAYAGQDKSVLDKGEALMVSTEATLGKPAKTLLIGEKLEHEIAGDSKTEEITPLKFTAVKSGTVEELFYETGGYAPSAEEKWAKSLTLAIQEDAGGGRPGNILGEGTYTGSFAINKVVSVGGLKVPIVKGKSYWLTFLPEGGSITYWYENKETVIFSEHHKSLVDSPVQSWVWVEEPDYEGKPSGAPIGLWAKGT